MLPTYYFIGLGIILCALGYVAWLLWDEKRKESLQASPEPSPANNASELPPVTPQSLLSRLGLKKDSPRSSPATENQEVIEKPKTRRTFIFPNLKDKLPFLNKSLKSQNASTRQPLSKEGGGLKNLITRLTGLLNKPKTIPPPITEEGTASLRLDQLNLPPAGSEDSSPGTAPASSNQTSPLEQDNTISAESELSLQLDEWKTKLQELQEKYHKLETLLTEKSQDLEKTEKTLINESKTHKEFNKLKDILEKELKDAKDKGRQLQNDLANAQTEIQTHIKRITQLEEKTKMLEKDILQKDDQNKDLQIDRQKYQHQLKELEETVRQKDAKIEDLVNLMKQEHKNLSIEPPTATSGHDKQTTGSEKSADPVTNQEPPAAAAAQIIQQPPISTEPSTPSEPPKSVEQETSPTPPTQSSLIPESTASANQPAPSDIPDSGPQASAHDHPTLAPDIFIDKPRGSDKNPSADSPPKKTDGTQGTPGKQT